MCGFLGLYDSRPVEGFERRCGDYLQRIHYRGPDDEGALFLTPGGQVWKGRGPCFFLGHKRLSIIDLSASGRQPMMNEDATLWIVFNGEIYNYREIRDTLVKKGHRFRSQTDTEVILHGYETWGIDILDRLRGMFAFGIFDTRKREVLIARDRMGQKPLVYAKRPGLFAFSSELKALYSYPRLKTEISPRSIHYFLTYQYIPHKHTIFKDIYKLLPAHYAIYHIESGSFTRKRYWQPTFNFRDNPLSKREEKKHVEELESLLKESVRLRLRSDVPLGVFLSGGVDSSAITYFATRLLPAAPKTFSISFEEQAFDESSYALEVARALKTDHHAYTVRSQGLLTLPRLVWLYNEPFGDSSMIPTYYVSKVTAENVKVVLSGDGGDEVFLGYNRYRLYTALKGLQQTMKHIPISLLRAFFHALSRTRLLGKYPVMLENFFSRVQTDEALNYSLYVIMIHDRIKDELYTPAFREVAVPRKAMDLVDKLFHHVSRKDLKQAFSYTDFLTYLPGDILAKVDIASMANSLECRSPFLDHKIVEFTCRLPSREKLHFTRGKRILKRCLRDKLPRRILKRRKMGFGVPIGRWFREDKWASLLREILLSPSQKNRGYFKQDALERMIEEHVSGAYDRSAMLWQLLVLELWHRTFNDMVVPRPLDLGLGGTTLE